MKFLKNISRFSEFRGRAHLLSGICASIKHHVNQGSLQSQVQAAEQHQLGGNLHRTFQEERKGQDTPIPVYFSWQAGSGI